MRNRFKKLMTSTLIGVLVLTSIPISASATEINISGDTTQHEVSSSFTVEVCNVEVIVPDNLNLDTEDTYNGETGLSCTAEIKAIGKMLPSKKLRITAPSTIEYKWAPDVSVEISGDLLMNKGEESGVITIKADELNDTEAQNVADIYVFVSYLDILKGGSYNGTVTFNFEVTNITTEETTDLNVDDNLDVDEILDDNASLEENEETN